MSETSEDTNTPKPISPHSLTKREMRASFLLPIAIVVGVWLLAAPLYFLNPEARTLILGVVVIALLLILLYWTRNESMRLRIIAIFMAIPALIGLSIGMINGEIVPIFIGLGITLLLLAGYRAISTPISYRFAYRSFAAGQFDQALELVNKAIASRPDFWESYQLKALIYLSQTEFARAESAAKEAIEHNPKQFMPYNTLGQIYLAQAQFKPAQEAFAQAVSLDDRHALNWYQLGVCQYRQDAMEAAAESLLAATQRSPRIVEYELLTFFYLWRTQVALKNSEKAEEILQKMGEFVAGLDIWQINLSNQPDYAYKSLLEADIAELDQLLNKQI